MSLNKKRYFRSKTQRKIHFPFVFPSLIRNFASAFTASTKINGKIASKDKETPASAH